MNNQETSKNIYFINMIGGVSGDMLIGALLSLGVSVSELNKSLLLLPLKGLKLTETYVKRGPVQAVLAQPVLNDDLSKKQVKKSKTSRSENLFIEYISKDFL